jgi:hypothetical protein
MALKSTPQQPTRERIRTQRPFQLVDHVTENGQVVGLERRVVPVGEVLDVSIELARQLVVAKKAEFVDAKTPLGVPPEGKKAA